MSGDAPEESIYPPGSHRLSDTSIGDKFFGALDELDPNDEYGRRLPAACVFSSSRSEPALLEMQGG